MFRHESSEVFKPKPEGRIIECMASALANAPKNVPASAGAAVRSYCSEEGGRLRSGTQSIPLLLLYVQPCRVTTGPQGGI